MAGDVLLEGSLESLVVRPPDNKQLVRRLGADDLDEDTVVGPAPHPAPTGSASTVAAAPSVHRPFQTKP